MTFAPAMPSPTVRVQVYEIARRSVLRSARQPAQIVPAFIFPLFLLAVNSSGLQAATDVPGFPTDSFLSFAIALTFMQGALFGTMNAGTDIARDIETGFLNRLSLTPLRKVALLAGQLAGATVLGFAQAIGYLIVGLAAGAGFKAGIGGIPVLLGLSVMTTVAFSSIGAWMALRTGSGEAVQGLFPLLFVLLFLSSATFPRNLIEQDWFHTVATYNPVSYLVEGIRSLFLVGWDGEALAMAFGIAILIAAAGLTLAARAMRTVVVRT